MKMPEFWRCGGGCGLPYKYGFGYWIKDVEYPNGAWLDLLCVNKRPKYPELELSPACDSRFKALMAFTFKRIKLLTFFVYF